MGNLGCKYLSPMWSEHEMNVCHSCVNMYKLFVGFVHHKQHKRENLKEKNLSELNIDCEV